MTTRTSSTGRTGRPAARRSQKPSPTRGTVRPQALAVRSAPPPAPGDGVILRTNNLHKWYGSVHALDGVNVEVRRGEVVGFLGPNGAGKTTFTKCVLGFLRPNAGTVHLFNQEVHRSPREVLDRVGVVPDQYDFYGSFNGVQHLNYYGKLYGVDRSKLSGRIEEVLTMVGMKDLAHRKVRKYSHGMKQRLCIAQALLNRPEFIIFDEPTNGLDPRGAFEVRELIQKLSQDGTTIFLSSHILPEVEQVCDRVAILSKGRVLTQASVGDLRKRLKGDRVRVIITVENPSPELERIPIHRGAARQTSLEGNRLVCDLGPDQDIPELVGLLAKHGVRIQSVQEETVNLEQIFLELTKGEGGL